MQIIKEAILADGRTAYETDTGEMLIKQGDEAQPEVITVWSVMPVAMLDIPMSTPQFALYDADNNVVGYQTIKQHCDVTPASYRLSNDGTHAIFGYEMSDLENDLSKAKALATEAGLKLGGKDFAKTAKNVVWLGLNYKEIQQFLAVNPMFAVDESNV